MEVPRPVPFAIHRPSLVALVALVLVSLSFAVGLVLGGAVAPAAPATDEGASGLLVDESDGDPLARSDGGGPDTDGDGLSDAAERELGTNASDPDTDGDGYPDGMEVTCGARLPDADPLRQDVYVEVDSTADASLSPAVRNRVERAFADAPLANPGGEMGIALHLVESDDELPQADVVGNRERSGPYDDLADYRTGHFDGDAWGYYYLIVVSNASYRGDPSYAGAGYNGTALVQRHDDARTTATLVMHELGHAFGMGHGWDGVDEHIYTLSEYRSVMNYNGLYRVLDYADGLGEVGRDEWEFVAEDRYRPSVDCDGECRPTC